MISKNNKVVEVREMQNLECQKCGHKWIPRLVPQMCPRCKSYKWNDKTVFKRKCCIKCDICKKYFVEEDVDLYRGKWVCRLCEDLRK